LSLAIILVEEIIITLSYHVENKTLRLGIFALAIFHFGEIS